jgi:hypothetical protein
LVGILPNPIDKLSFKVKFVNEINPRPNAIQNRYSLDNPQLKEAIKEESDQLSGAH